MELSRDEQNLINFAREEFGESLTQFLLAGFGDETTEQRWHFIITFIGSEGDAMEKRHVQVITHEPADGSSCLPQRRDPLVLLALLWLLKQEGQVSKPEVLYSLEDIFSLLAWDNTEETRQEIDEAIYQYSLLMYRWEMNRPELSRREISFYKENGHVITSFQTVDEEVGEGEETKRAHNRVSFDEFFINGLLRRELFGVDWNKVQSLKMGKSSSRL